MKFPTILAVAALVAGFVPLGQAICYDGDIALVFQNPVSTTFQSEKHHILKMIRLGRSVAMTAAISLVARLRRCVGIMAMPM